MPVVIYVAIAAVALGVGGLVFVVFTTIPSKRDVAAVVASSTAAERERVERGSFGDTLAAVMPGGYSGWVQKQILYAGKAGQWSVGGFFLLRFFVTIIALLVVLFTILLSSALIFTVLGIAFALLFGVVPEVILSSRADDRQKAIQLALPDTLDQMTIAVEAGLGFEAAMAKVTQNTSGPLADEFRRTMQDISIGRSRFDAYAALLARTNCDDLKRFVRAIQQADRYGIAVADVLRVQAGEMRLKRRQRAEEKAAAVPIKVVFPLVFAILPVLFIVMLFPAVLGIIGAFSHL